MLLTGCLASNAQTFHDRTNQLRGSHGVPALHHHGALEAKAQRWAETIAARGSLQHSRLAEGLDGVAWRSLGENLARASLSGDWARSLHDSLVGSSVHRANLLDRRFTHMGVGLAESRGQIYVVQVFAEIR